MLAPNTAVDITGGGRVVVGRSLGEGGQAYVFEVRDHVGNPYALKWYKMADPAQYDSLAKLIDYGPPSERFLWPLALATVPGHTDFGYLMPLRPPEYIELVHLMHGHAPDGRPIIVSTAGTLTSCYHLAREFLRLHARGLCYRDINFGNVFLVPATGQTMICDNDNVGVDGSPGFVAGTMDFMAPEVVRLHFGADRGRPPSARTDRHSLAVVLFYMLFIAHPLQGMKNEHGIVDDPWKLLHYGTDPLFIFDPKDERNRPVQDTPSRYWQHYPGFLRELFCEAFGAGLQDPDARVTESIWSGAMLRLRDSLTECGQCGGVIFVDWDEPRRACVRCGNINDAPRSLQIGNKRIAISTLTRVHSDHFGGDPDVSVAVGAMTQKPMDPDCWGICNLTDKPWTATGADGRVHEVPVGRNIQCDPGTRIQFGRGHGTVLP
ncbi:MAG: protein kinase domain-containing protein [Sporichthyaceae bacterium]